MAAGGFADLLALQGVWLGGRRRRAAAEDDGGGARRLRELLENRKRERWRAFLLTLSLVIDEADSS